MIRALSTAAAVPLNSIENQYRSSIHEDLLHRAFQLDLCAKLCRTRTQTGGGIRGVVQQLGFYRVLAETVATETHDEDHNGVDKRVDSLCLTERDLGAEDTKLTDSTDSGRAPTPGLSLARDS